MVSEEQLLLYTVCHGGQSPLVTALTVFESLTITCGSVRDFPVGSFKAEAHFTAHSTSLAVAMQQMQGFVKCCCFDLVAFHVCLFYFYFISLVIIFMNVGDSKKVGSLKFFIDGSIAKRFGFIF